MARYRISLILFLALTVTVCLQAQEQGSVSSNAVADAVAALPLDSPFNHLQAPKLTKAASTGIRPYNCLGTSYYDHTTSTVEYQDSTPTRVWAMKMTLPTNPAVTRCTVWTVNVNFWWQPKQQGLTDTMHIFMREAYAPYNEFYHSKYLMKLGENKGAIEIDPPIPPYTRPVIYPKREVYVGIYVTGQYGSKVNWRVKTPSFYTGRSFIFAAGNPVPVSGVIGYNADWIFEAMPCCDFPWPIELSTFTGLYNGEGVELSWRTETETNNYQFEVQRSLYNNGPWESRGFIAGNGTTSGAKDYTFTDNLSGMALLPDAYWYRLRQTDFDGTVSDFPPIRVSTSLPTASGFALHSAYPNPISSSNYTTITYDVPSESPVDIAVYDAMGNKVATLVNQVMLAGTYQAVWYAANSVRPLSDGTYFIVMRTGIYTATRKITLLH